MLRSRFGSNSLALRFASGALALGVAGAIFAPTEAFANSTCTLKGEYPLSKGVQIFDSASGGRVIGTFTGSAVPLSITSIPSDPQTGRAKVSTSGSTPGLRLNGYVPASLVSVFTAKDVPVSGSAVAIASGYRVKLVGASSTGLTVEHSVSGGASQTVKGTAACESFSLDKVKPSAMSVGSDMRAYSTKSSAVEIFDSAGSSKSVFTLNLGTEVTHIFWSGEKQGDFVRVKSRADLVIDGWAKMSNLTLLPKRSMEDSFVPSPGATVSSSVELDSKPETIRASKQADVRLKRDDKEPAVGVVEAGAELYVAQKIGAWVNVMPKHLGVAAPDGSGYWVRKKSL